MALKIFPPPQKKNPSDCQSKKTLFKEGSLLSPCYVSAEFIQSLYFWDGAYGSLRFCHSVHSMADLDFACGLWFCEFKAMIVLCVQVNCFEPLCCCECK